MTDSILPQKCFLMEFTTGLVSSTFCSNGRLASPTDLPHEETRCHWVFLVFGSSSASDHQFSCPPMPSLSLRYGRLRGAFSRCRRYPGRLTATALPVDRLPGRSNRTALVNILPGTCSFNISYLPGAPVLKTAEAVVMYTGMNGSNGRGTVCCCWYLAGKIFICHRGGEDISARMGSFFQQEHATAYKMELQSITFFWDYPKLLPILFGACGVATRCYYQAVYELSCGGSLLQGDSRSTNHLAMIHLISFGVAQDAR